MRTLILTLTLMIVCTLHCQSQDSKWIKGTQEYGIHCNFDVYIDTTGISDNTNSITLQNRVYSKGGYVVLLKNGTFKRQYDNQGKPIPIQMLTKDDLTQEFRDEILPKLENLSMKYGDFQITYKPVLNGEGIEIEKKIFAYEFELDTIVNSHEFLEYINKVVELPCDYACEPQFIIGSVAIEGSIGNIDIFPNPVSDFLMIRSLDESQFQSISIFNTFGQKLYEGDLKEQIDVSSLTPGVYFIRIGDKVEKFVKM